MFMVVVSVKLWVDVSRAVAPVFKSNPCAMSDAALHLRGVDAVAFRKSQKNQKKENIELWQG